MSIKSTRRYFSYEFLIVKHKFNGNYITILQQIYEWMFSDNPPRRFVENGKVYFYISQSYLSRMNAGICSQPYISKMFKYFREIGLIIDTKTLNDNKEYYIAFNWDIVKQTLLEDEEINMKYSNNWFERINSFADEQIEAKNNSYNNSEEKNMLLDESDMNAGKKRGYSKQADAIAKRILKKYAQYFTTKYPLENQEPTKTYSRLCKKIDDIYNGRFTSSRFYDFDEGVFNNKQFETGNWREEINAVKNDWGKVKELIFAALNNFILMYEPERMPLNKEYLTTNLNDWFFSDNPNSKGQSQFIQSLNEPMYTKQKLGLNKAKVIVQELKEKSPVSYYAGHELNELLPTTANEGTAWNYIQDIIKWGKLLWQFDNNSHYFMQANINDKNEAGPKVLPALFARYLKDKEINVSLNTLNIEQAVDNNGPWCWFIKDACKKYNINEDYLQCFESEDFYDACKGNKKIGFYDMNEIIF